MKKYALISSLIIIPFTTSVTAQMGGGMGGGMPVFGDIDTDGNGSLTQEEMNVLPNRRGGSSDQRFALFDADGDGAITEEEFNSFFANRRGGGAMGGGMGR